MILRHPAPLCHGRAMRDATSFGADTTTDEVLEGLDLCDRIVLVTGGSSGLGQERARALAATGAQVILTARDAAEGRGGRRRRSAPPPATASVEVEELELGVAGQRPRLRAALPRPPSDRLDVLAQQRRRHGVPARAHDRRLRAAVRHEPPRALPADVPPRAGARAGARRAAWSRSARAAITSSPVDLRRHRTSSGAPYHKWPSYGQSKTANVLFAVGLERRLGPRGVHANALHPGGDHDRARPPPASRRTSSSCAPGPRRRGDAVQDGRGGRGDVGVRRDGAGARGPRRPLSRGLPRRRA